MRESFVEKSIRVFRKSGADGYNPNFPHTPRNGASNT